MREDNKSIVIRLFSLFDSGVILHSAEGIGQKSGELSIVHVVDPFGGERFSVADCNLSAGRKELLMAWPGFEGAVNNDGQNGGLASFGQQGDAALKPSYAAVRGSSGFREQTNGTTLLQSCDDRFHGRQIGPAPPDRNGVDRGNQRPKERVCKEGLAGEVVQLSFERHSAEDGVEIALMVADKYKGALSGDIVPAVCAQTKEQDAKDPANPACEPEPYCS